MTAAPPDPPPRDPSIRPDYDDFRDEEGRIDWRAFRAAVAAYDPGPGGVVFVASGEPGGLAVESSEYEWVETEAAPPGEGGAAGQAGVS